MLAEVNLAPHGKCGPRLYTMQNIWHPLMITITRMLHIRIAIFICTIWATYCTFDKSLNKY